MPVVDQISTDYADDVTFLAIGWKSSFDRTADRAGQLMPSGNILWGLDESEDVFRAFEVPYQPVTVLVARGTIVERWPGLRSPDELRAALDNLVAVAGG